MIRNLHLTAALIALGASAPALAQDLDVISGEAFLTRVVTGSDILTTTSPTYDNLMTTTVFVPPGSSLVTVDFSAESRCTEASAAGSWCTARILINGSEGAPAAGTNYAFDSTDNGNATFANYGARSMTRSLCVTNNTGSNARINVGVDWAVQDFSGSTEFWIDDWTVKAVVTKKCVPQ